MEVNNRPYVRATLPCSHPEMLPAPLLGGAIGILTSLGGWDIEAIAHSPPVF
jgi:hypothetical protein